jgi:trehalose 6-phosphate synthase
VIVVSHRGPYLFSLGEGGVVATRGPGGLAGTLHSLATSSDALHDACCISAANSDGDRAVAHGAPPPELGTNVRFVELDPDLHQPHIEVISNEILWFLFHGLFDLVREPTFDESLRPAWDAYVEVNQVFANEVTGYAPDGDTVLVQDYPLALVPGMLRESRPDLRLSYFAHTPFCGASSIRVLPNYMARSICESLASVPAGFHTRRWVREYSAAVLEVLDHDPLDDGSCFVAPLGPDPTAFARVAASEPVAVTARDVDALVGDRTMIFRTDRIDPAKNIVRGFLAYDHLLETRPEWREHVVFVAMLTNSRVNLAEYVRYQQEVADAVTAVNDRWSTPSWQPILVDTIDSFERTVAAYTRYDVLLVNSMKDGLNLVAKEGPLVNERDGVLCLSPETGSYEELRSAAIEVHPWDVAESADALRRALSMSAEERAARARRLRELAVVHTPATWLDANVSHAR